eukprot:TRINITY_DN47148_c0_g1_i1.p1 TRINITY_DN47148_c0_g1~~TRINITY_DN47148_c0_g1_i1.p1  ORF type:complete len:392 (+),score=132.53 TRINITY_DN47148_c0_g1_i1:88-1263(+)
MQRSGRAAAGAASGLRWALVAQRRFGHPDTFRAAEMQKNLSSAKAALPPLEKLVFGERFSTHMLKCDWDRQDGWGAPRIEPYADLSLSPAASSLHYALQCFEGMKAYRRKDGEVYIFRPDMNAKRMLRSSTRLEMPGFDIDEFVKAVKELVWVDRDWIPQERGYSLYIRPTMISTDRCLGVAPPRSAMFYVILSPVGPYYREGFKPVKLLADSMNVRAWQGGVGDYKVGANYGPTIHPQVVAGKSGFAQVLWLGPGETVTEVGSMNMMFYWTNTAGEKEVITAPLDGTVLPGVTRDSVLTLLREWGECKVTERAATIHEVIQAIQDGRMHEAFGTGTAAVISLVDGISYKDQLYSIPVPGKDGLSIRLLDRIQSIQMGEVEHPWSIRVTGA